MGGGICGAGLSRLADALLKALGGETVSLLLPATAMANDAGGQLGLVDPGVQEIVISPAILREMTTEHSGHGAGSNSRCLRRRLRRNSRRLVWRPEKICSTP